MPRYEITSPDGKRWEVDAPDGATQDQVLAYAQQQWSAKPAGAAPGPMTRNNDLAAQAGLTLRAAGKGVMALPGMANDAIGGLLNAGQDLALGKGRGYRFQPTQHVLDNLMTSAGLPQPDTPMQRIVGKAVEVGSGGASGAALMGRAATGASGVTQQVLQRMAANPGAQAFAGVTAGAAGQQAAENGAGWGGQFVASLLGGLGGAGLASGAKSLAESAKRALAPTMQPAQIEARVTAALQNRGIDPASITPAMRTSLMQDVKAALKTGDNLDDAALARLADYRRLGMTPTRGRVSLDPLDVTREQNAMRMAAATGARDAQLPQIAQANNQRLLSHMDDMQPLPDRALAGERVMGPILQRDAAMQAAERSLYDKARGMAGGDIPLDSGKTMNGIFTALDADLKTPFLPEGVAKVLNRIQAGEMPLDVRTLDVLKTMLSTAQRATGDGNVKRALSIVRNELDNAPIVPAGNPAFGGATAAAMREADNLMSALNEARGAAFQRRQWQESAPGIARALDGATADTFVQQNILASNAGARDVTRLAAELAGDPTAMQAVRGSIVQHLKDQAIGKGNSAQTANFSGRQWSAALSGIGDRKLGLFFDPTELEQLKAIGRVGTIETFQPRGSAVNNSNTAAALGNLLQGVSGLVKPWASKLPFGQQAINQPLDNITLSLMERGAMRAPAGLLSTVPGQRPPGLLDQLLLPMAAGGGLLAPPAP